MVLFVKLIVCGAHPFVTEGEKSAIGPSIIIIGDIVAIAVLQLFDAVSVIVYEPAVV